MTDGRIKRVAEALYDDARIGSHSFPRSRATEYWPGLEARKFLAMLDAALSESTPAPSQAQDRYEADAIGGVNQGNPNG